MEILKNNWFNIEFCESPINAEGRACSLFSFMLTKIDELSCGEQNFSNYTEGLMFEELKQYYDMFMRHNKIKEKEAK